MTGQGSVTALKTELVKDLSPDKYLLRTKRNPASYKQNVVKISV